MKFKIRQGIACLLILLLALSRNCSPAARKLETPIDKGQGAFAALELRGYEPHASLRARAAGHALHQYGRYPSSSGSVLGCEQRPERRWRLRAPECLPTWTSHQGLRANKPSGLQQEVGLLGRLAGRLLPRVHHTARGLGSMAPARKSRRSAECQAARRCTGPGGAGNPDLLWQSRRRVPVRLEDQGARS